VTLDPALLDELARCFAAAAVERALSGTNENAVGGAGKQSDDGVKDDDAKSTAPGTREPPPH
jgi:hypothetical protein